MNPKSVWLMILILVFFANGLLAEDRPFPYELSSRDFVLLPIGAGLSLLGDSLIENYRSITPEEIRTLDRNDVNAFDRPATYNWSFEWDDRSGQYRDILVTSTLFMLAIPPLFHAKLMQTFTVAAMFVEAYLFVRGITYLTKATFGRERPYLYNTALSVKERHSAGSDDAFFSFYSGHSAAAFTAATFLSKVITDIHGKSAWTTLLWGSSLSLATFAGYSRVKCGQHFPTDVIVGAAAGFAIGYLIPVLHKKKTGSPVSITVASNQVCLSLRF